MALGCFFRLALGAVGAMLPSVAGVMRVESVEDSVW